jgi:hypothetical protein
MGKGWYTKVREEAFSLNDSNLSTPPLTGKGGKGG